MAPGESHMCPISLLVALATLVVGGSDARDGAGNGAGNDVGINASKDDEAAAEVDVWPHEQPGVQAAPFEFRDPFYAFVLEIVENDSLGFWTHEDLQRYMDRSGRKTRLPLEHLQSVERRPAADGEAEYRRGARVGRIWCLTLDENLVMPMPYSILGYHPGSVHIGRTTVMSEWRLGERTIYVPAEAGITKQPVTGLTIFRLDSGWLVLDVHGWLDNLLGGKLDDCWTQGLAVCRCEGRMRGLTLSWNRDLKPLNGEFDFYKDEIMPMGGPFARGLDVFARPWIEPAEHSRRRYWQYDR